MQCATAPRLPRQPPHPCLTVGRHSCGPASPSPGWIISWGGSGRLIALRTFDDEVSVSAAAYWPPERLHEMRRTQYYGSEADITKAAGAGAGEGSEGGEEAERAAVQRYLREKMERCAACVRGCARV